MSGNSTIVSHTETYGINITGTNAFAVNATWALQPGISTYSKGTPLGAWLPQIATNFDNYELMSVKYTYRAACSTLEPGLVVFGFEPNPEASPPGTYQELRNMYSVDGSAHANLDFVVPSARIKRVLLTRKAAVINLPSYDAGKVYLAVVGATDAAKLGFVDVSYTVRLFNPQSANSSNMPVITYDQVSPRIRYSVFPGDGVARNCAASCLTVGSDICGGGNVTGTTDMFSIASLPVPVLDTTFAGGCQFKAPAAMQGLLLVKYSGRYRVTFNVNGDFQDLQLFAAAPIVLDLAGAWRAATETVLTTISGATTSEINALPRTHRGFSGTAVGDPNPGTDLPLIGTWDVSLTAGERLAMMLGVRTYNAISSTTANFTFKSNCGPCYIEAIFLGPAS